jgi:tetratricopeptide (TPR) repeat protein
VGHFTGRDRQLAELDRLVEEPVADVRIAVISGLAGMGKTALALEWGHRVSGRFPDGQIHLDLRGHEPRSAVPASAALSHLLRAVGVPADRIPAEPSDQGALYRSLVHERRMLILLDNAGSAEAVLPLVPAGAGNLLLVTSRNPLAALTTHHAVTSVGLDPLAEADAVALLGRVLGVSRVSREPESAVDLVRLCDRMPLALRIAAAKLVAHPGGRLQALVTTLEGGDRVDALSVEGDSRSVGTVFASAYRALSPPAARLFRRLGLHPGVTFSTGLAGALVDLDPAGTARVLAELADAHLVLPAGPDRHWFHDLIAIFARQCTAVDEPDPAEPVARLLDWYLAVAHAANRAVDPGRDRVTPVLGHPARPPFGPDQQAALRFLDGERGNLLPVVRYAAEHGRHTTAWQLTYLLTGYYDSRGGGEERVEMCRCAVEAARRAGDPAAEGLMRSGLGMAYNATRHFHEALAALAEALPLMRVAGDRRGEGHVHNNIAVAHTALRRFEASILVGLGEANLQLGNQPAALGFYRRALEMRRRTGDRRIEPDTLCDLGTAHLHQGDHAAALASFDQALTVSREVGDPHAEAVALADLGRAYLSLGDLAAARDHLGRALALRARVPDPYQQARTLGALGELEQRCGDPTAAAAHWARAQRLYRDANATDEADRLADQARAFDPGAGSAGPGATHQRAGSRPRS